MACRCPGGEHGWRGSRPGALARGGGKISDLERRAQRKIVTQKSLGKIAVYYVLSFSLADYYACGSIKLPCRLLHNPPCRLLHTHTTHLADYYTPHNPPCSLQITTHHRIHLADHYSPHTPKNLEGPPHAHQAAKSGRTTGSRYPPCTPKLMADPSPPPLPAELCQWGVLASLYKTAVSK